MPWSAPGSASLAPHARFAPGPFSAVVTEHRRAAAPPFACPRHRARINLGFLSARNARHAAVALPLPPEASLAADLAPASDDSTTDRESPRRPPRRFPKSSISSVSLSAARVPARSRTQKSSSWATSASCATGSPGKAGVLLAAPRVLLRFVRTSSEAAAALASCSSWRSGSRLHDAATTGVVRSA